MESDKKKFNEEDLKVFILKISNLVSLDLLS